jgi:hypothetical protein
MLLMLMLVMILEVLATDDNAVVILWEPKATAGLEEYAKMRQIATIDKNWFLMLIDIIISFFRII